MTRRAGNKQAFKEECVKWCGTSLSGFLKSPQDGDKTKRCRGQDRSYDLSATTLPHILAPWDGIQHGKTLQGWWSRAGRFVHFLYRQERLHTASYSHHIHINHYGGSKSALLLRACHDILIMAAGLCSCEKLESSCKKVWSWQPKCSVFICSCNWISYRNILKLYSTIYQDIWTSCVSGAGGLHSNEL